MKLKFQKLDKHAITPKYATVGAACFDLHALGPAEPLSDGVPCTPGFPLTVRTGLAFEIPKGHVMLVFSRSGHGFKHSTRLANCVGVIDSDYRGEIMVKLTTDENLHDNQFSILQVRPGDRIAQAMIVPIPEVELEEVLELSSTERGAGGFGSTGA